MQENILITHMKAAAVWCQNTVFEKGLELPAFLSMDKDNQAQTLKELQSWQGETDDDDSSSSPLHLSKETITKRSVKDCLPLSKHNERDGYKNMHCVLIYNILS